MLYSLLEVKVKCKRNWNLAVAFAVVSSKLNRFRNSCSRGILPVATNQIDNIWLYLLLLTFYFFTFYFLPLHYGMLFGLLHLTFRV